MPKVKREKTIEEKWVDSLPKEALTLKPGESAEEMMLRMFKPMLEKLLNAEMDEHLGYEKHEVSDISNSRNGYSEKIVKGLFGQTEIKTPRDRDGSFEPIIIPKREKNISKIESAIIKLYAKGTSTRDIQDFVESTYGVELDPTSVSRITDKILPEIEAFHTRPLEKVYPIVFIDGIRFKIREDNISKEVSAYIVLGVNTEGHKDVIGYWIGESESSKYWLSVLDDLKQRGVERILILASDNLKGISEAVKAAFPETKIQKCVVHQIRNSTKFVRYDHLREFTNDMKQIYQAPNINYAEEALNRFDEKWGKTYGYAIKSWRANFEELVTFFEFPSEIRKLIYTTNPIENLNRCIRKISKNKSFPNTKSLTKILYLAIQDQTKKWNIPIANWGTIYNQLTIMFGL